MQQRVNDKTARVIDKRRSETSLQMRKEVEKSDAPTRDRNPLGNITCRIGDNTCATKHISAIQRTGILHPMNKSQRVQSLTKLQRQYGNRFVQRVIAQNAIQTKLTIGQPGDIYEQEADKVAEQVTRAPESRVQRQLGEEEREEEEVVGAKELPGQTPSVTSAVEDSINAIKGGGQPLPASVRSFSEPRFGYDFSRVRVHTDAQAAKTAQAVNARAFTVGQDIVFGSGQYAPEASEGKRLLAHELTHVAQQTPLPSRHKSK